MPAQLFESFIGILNIGILKSFPKKKRTPGHTLNWNYVEGVQKHTERVGFRFISGQQREYAFSFHHNEVGFGF